MHSQIVGRRAIAELLMFAALVFVLFRAPQCAGLYGAHGRQISADERRAGRCPATVDELLGDNSRTK